jgi:hypothetical protein
VYKKALYGSGPIIFAFTNNLLWVHHRKLLNWRRERLGVFEGGGISGTSMRSDPEHINVDQMSSLEQAEAKSYT